MSCSWKGIYQDEVCKYTVGYVNVGVSENKRAAHMFWGYVRCRGAVLWSSFLQAE